MKTVILAVTADSLWEEGAVSRSAKHKLTAALAQLLPPVQGLDANAAGPSSEDTVVEQRRTRVGTEGNRLFPSVPTD